MILHFDCSIRRQQLKKLLDMKKQKRTGRRRRRAMMMASEGCCRANKCKWPQKVCFHFRWGQQKRGRRRMGTRLTMPVRRCCLPLMSKKWMRMRKQKKGWSWQMHYCCCHRCCYFHCWPPSRWLLRRLELWWHTCSKGWWAPRIWPWPDKRRCPSRGWPMDKKWPRRRGPNRTTTPTTTGPSSGDGR